MGPGHRPGHRGSGRREHPAKSLDTAVNSRGGTVVEDLARLERRRQVCATSSSLFAAVSKAPARTITLSIPTIRPAAPNSSSRSR